MKFCQSCDNLLYLKIIDSKPEDSESGEESSSAGTSADAGMLDNPCELKYYCRMCNEMYNSD